MIASNDLAAGESALVRNFASASGAGETENRITLGVLTAVADTDAVSQRALAKDLGIALGLANAYVKRCVRKGLVKVRGAPAKRYAYYLTPRGFTEKSRLTALYLARSFDFYCEARAQIDACFALCTERNFQRVALYGAGALAEIATVVATRHPVTLVAVVDERMADQRFLPLLPAASIASLADVDAVLLTDLVAPQRSFEKLREAVGDERIVAPALLNISYEQPVQGDTR